MEERNGSNVNAVLNDGTGCGSFFNGTDNQDCNNMFPDIVHIRKGTGFLTINPENPRALQKLTTEDVLDLHFNSCEAGESFYHKYASTVGFVVQEDEIGRNKLGVGSLVLEFYHIVPLVMDSLEAKEFWKMCMQLAPWGELGQE